MRQIITIILQILVVLLGAVVLYGMIRFPLTEGRAVNLDLISIYTDSFILYAYLSSIAFFVGLYQAFKLLGRIRQDNLFSDKSVRSLKIIKYCALVLCVLIIGVAVYIRIFHAADEDPAGFIALSIVATFAAIVIAFAATLFEKKIVSIVNKI